MAEEFLDSEHVAVGRFPGFGCELASECVWRISGRVLDEPVYGVRADVSGDVAGKEIHFGPLTQQVGGPSERGTSRSLAPLPWTMRLMPSRSPTRSLECETAISERLMPVFNLPPDFTPKKDDLSVKDPTISIDGRTLLMGESGVYSVSMDLN